jgi:protoporphyrinogen oxidase
MSGGTIVIAGGGLAALYAAHTIRKLGDRRPLVIVERAPEVGGLLRALDAGPWGKFDQGMHTFTSCGIDEIDHDVHGMLPEPDWVVLKDERRDLSGVVFAGRLQHHCHYPDLRLLGEAEYRACLADFFQNLAGAEPADAPADMDAYARRRFGPRIAASVIDPILKKLYDRPASAIDPVVATLLPLDRVALYDEAPFADLMRSPLLRARIAFPEQRRLPLTHASGRWSLYPRAFGAYRLVDALVARLRATGVRLVTRAEIVASERAGGRVRAVIVRTDAGEAERIDGVAELYWTAGVLPLARHLGLPSGRDQLEAPKIAATINLLLDRRPDVGDLYYFWCFDPAFAAFRVTSFFNYCPGAARAGGWPVCVELFLDPSHPLDPPALATRAVEELSAIGVLQPESRVLAHAGQALPVGFPILSTANRELLERALREIGSLALANLTVTGIQSAWGVVFQPDVLVHTWRAVRDRYGLHERGGGPTVGPPPEPPPQMDDRDAAASPPLGAEPKMVSGDA